MSNEQKTQGARFVTKPPALPVVEHAEKVSGTFFC